MTRRMMTVIALASMLLWGAGSMEAASAADVAGKWHFVLETPGGPRESHSVLEVNGEKVTGKWENSDVQGTFIDGALELNFRISSAEAEGMLKISGKLDGDTISGTWVFESYDGTFKATREK